MKNWYSTRDGANIQHKAHTIANGKHIFLTEAQAKLHGDAIKKSEAPKNADEAGIKTEFEEWSQASLDRRLADVDVDVDD